jgi:hypothetical protein
MERLPIKLQTPKTIADLKLRNPRWKIPLFKGYKCIITFFEIKESLSGVSVVSYSSPVSLENFDSTFCALSFALFPILKARITNLESRNQFRNPHSKFRIQKAPFPLFPSSPTRRAVALVRCDASRRAQRVNLFPFLPFNLLIHLDLCQQPMIFCKP